jgi:hypothetical protein
VSDLLAFVHFPHPGGEQGPDADNERLKSWGTDEHEHRRKFMQMPGAWRDNAEGPTREGEIVFWGEWEAASTVEPVDRHVDGGPHWLHRPFYKGIGDAPREGIRQNTDPFVFGDQFAYTYCRQPSNKNLRRLAPGSLILFGSTRKRRFVLDTCFVVGERIAHTPHDYRDVALPRVPHVFAETTLHPMYQQMSRACSLYLAATPDRAAANGTYSFVPCLPAAERRTFARPSIDLERPLIKLGRTQQAGTIPVDDPAALRGLWERIVARVLETCALGVRVALPRPR